MEMAVVCPSRQPKEGSAKLTAAFQGRSDVKFQKTHPRVFALLDDEKFAAAEGTHGKLMSDWFASKRKEALESEKASLAIEIDEKKEKTRNIPFYAVLWSALGFGIIGLGALNPEKVPDLARNHPGQVIMVATIATLIDYCIAAWRTLHERAGMKSINKIISRIAAKCDEIGKALEGCLN